MKIFTALLVILFLSCSIEDDDRTTGDIKGDLSAIVPLISVIEAGLNLVDENSVGTNSRALSPTWSVDSSNEDMETYFGSDWQSNPYKPSKVYTDNGGDGVSIVRIPQTDGTHIKNYNGNTNQEFYFTLEPISTKKYRLKLYIYPRDDFNTDYVYEEYVVDEDNEGTWNWQNFDNTGISNSWIKQTTYYRDGSENNRDTVWSASRKKVDEVYNQAPALDLSVNDLIADNSLYEYFTDEPVYTISDDGTSDPDTPEFYSSKTLGRLKGKRVFLDIIEYYTQETVSGGYIMRNVQFIESTKRWDSEKIVTRSNKDTVLDKSNYLSLTVTGGKWDSISEIEKIERTSTTYKSENHFWYKPISSVTTVDDANSVILDLTKNENLFEGTSTQYWGSSGEVYNYSINTITGEIITKWIESTTRTIANQSFSITDVSDITISSGNWEFSGYYELGELVGTYSYNGDTSDVVVDLYGIEIEGKKYKWE